jgi:hypothetical protein
MITRQTIPFNMYMLQSAARTHFWGIWNSWHSISIYHANDQQKFLDIDVLSFFKYVAKPHFESICSDCTCHALI